MLLDLADEHRGAFEYDWRCRFGVRFDPPSTTDWGESSRLLSVLVCDPSSAVAAAVAGWAHPVTREWVALKAVHDRYVDGTFKAPRALHLAAPWDPEPTRHGRTDLTREQVLEILATQRGLPDGGAL